MPNYTKLPKIEPDKAKKRCPWLKREDDRLYTEQIPLFDRYVQKLREKLKTATAQWVFPVKKFLRYYANMMIVQRYPDASCGDGETIHSFFDFPANLLEDTDVYFTGNEEECAERESDWIEDLSESEIETLFRYACYDYLYYRITRDPSLDASNYVRLAAPENDNDLAELLALYLSEVTEWLNRSQFKYTIKKERDNNHRADLDAEKRKNAELLEQIAEAEKAKSEMESRCNEAITQQKRIQREYDVLLKNSNVDEYVAKINELTRQLEKSQANEQATKRKYEALKDQIAADNDEPIPEEDDNRKLSLSPDARIVFVADPPLSGKLENYFNSIVNEFPNSRIVYSPADCNTECDAVVILTKYLCHGNYWRIKAVCAAHDIPCYHCGVKAINRIKELLLGS